MGKITIVRVGRLIYKVDAVPERCESINEAKRQCRVPGKQGLVRALPHGAKPQAIQEAFE